MPTFDIPFAPNKMPVIKTFDGDQQVLTQDTSPYRIGSHSTIGATPNQTSTLRALTGAQVMYYETHNTALDSNGNFMPRDDTGACTLQAYCEDEVWRYYSAPSANKGTLPVWAQVYGIDLSNPTSTTAKAGCTGEYITGAVATPGVSLTSPTAANVGAGTNLALTAGDWDVWGQIYFLPAATTTINILSGGVGTATGTLPALTTGFQAIFSQVSTTTAPGAVTIGLTLPTNRMMIAAGGATVYLVAQSTFATSTMTAYGNIFARRIR